MDTITPSERARGWLERIDTRVIATSREDPLLIFYYTLALQIALRGGAREYSSETTEAQRLQTSFYEACKSIKNSFSVGAALLFLMSCRLFNVYGQRIPPSGAKALSMMATLVRPAEVEDACDKYLMQSLSGGSIFVLENPRDLEKTVYDSFQRALLGREDYLSQSDVEISLLSKTIIALTGYGSSVLFHK